MRERSRKKFIEPLRLSGGYHLQTRSLSQRRNAWNRAFDQGGGTYRISRTVIRKHFSTSPFELGESRKSIIPGRDPDRVERISVFEVLHGEAG